MLISVLCICACVVCVCVCVCVYVYVSVYSCMCFYLVVFDFSFYVQGLSRLLGITFVRKRFYLQSHQSRSRLGAFCCCCCCCCCCSCCWIFFETGLLCIALVLLELTLLTTLASNSEIHLPLPPRVLGL